jgi:hypothetical protein
LSPEYPASWMGALHEVQTRVTVSVFSSWSVSSSKQSKPKEKGKDVCKKRPQKSFKKQVLLRDPSDDEWGESPEYPASWMGALHEVQTRVTVSVFSSWSVSSSHQRRESSPSRRKRARTSAKSAHKSHSKSKYY